MTMLCCYLSTTDLELRPSHDCKHWVLFLYSLHADSGCLLFLTCPTRDCNLMCRRSLLREPHRLHDLVAAMVAAVGAVAPVTVKLRSGFHDASLLTENLLAAQVCCGATAYPSALSGSKPITCALLREGCPNMTPLPHVVAGGRCCVCDSAPTHQGAVIHRSR